MIDIIQIFLIVLTIVFSIDAIIALLYALPIIFIRQFHTTQNILLGNVAFVSFISACYFIFYSIELYYYWTTWYKSKSLCVIISYGSLMMKFLLVYSFITITINRYLKIVYPNKPSFKKRTWALVSIIIHWIISIILGMPELFVTLRVNIE